MNRQRLLQLVTLMLYAGPLIAGLAGFGWAMTPAFIVIFVTWQIIMRPADWPRDPARWNESSVLTGAGLRVVLMVVLVAICFGAGRGLGGAVGYIPALPITIPVFLSLAAIPLARLLHNPNETGHMDTMLDDAVRRLKTFDKDVAFPSADAQHILNSTQLALRLLQPVQDLPADTSSETIGHHLRAIATQVDDARLREALVERAEGKAPSRSLLTALVMHTTDGAMMGKLGTDTVDPAFAALPDDAGLLTLFATRAVASVTGDDATRQALPSAALIEARLQRMTASAAEAPLRAMHGLSAGRTSPSL